MSQPWDRRRGEDDLAYVAFQQWLMGGHPRPSSRQLAETLEQRLAKGELPDVERIVDKRTLQRWRIRHDWEARSAAFDSFLLSKEIDGAGDVRRLVGQAGEIDRFRERNLQAAQMMFALGLTTAKVANKRLRQLSEGDDPPATVLSAVRTAGSAIQLALDVEAAILGLDDIIGTLSRSRERGDLVEGEDEVG